MRQSGVGQSRGCEPQRSCVRSLATASCVVPSTEGCVPTADEALEAGVCADTLSLTPLLRYDGRMAHALSPTPDARDAHALLAG